jgi:hypothetical protein
VIFESLFEVLFASDRFRLRLLVIVNDTFDVVSSWADDKGSVVARMIRRSCAWSAVVLATSIQRSSIEFVDLFGILQVAHVSTCDRAGCPGLRAFRFQSNVNSEHWSIIGNRFPVLDSREPEPSSGIIA